MHLLKTHCQEVVQRDGILVEAVSTAAMLAKPTKIVLSIGGAEKESPMASLLALDCIGNQRPYLTRNKIYGSKEVVGGKLTLRGVAMYVFMYKLLFEVLPQMKQFEGLRSPAHPGAFSFTLEDVLSFEGLGPLFFYLEDLGSLQCQISFTTKDEAEVLTLGRGLYLCFPPR